MSVYNNLKGINKYFIRIRYIQSFLRRIFEEHLVMYLQRSALIFFFILAVGLIGFVSGFYRIAFINIVVFK